MELSAGELRQLAYCVSAVLRARRRQNQVRSWLVDLDRRLTAEIVSRARRGTVSAEPHSDVWIGSPRAAEILGWSKRQVQRRAADLDGQIVAGRWLFRESTVHEYARGLGHKHD
jgi:hypothetical protein